MPALATPAPVLPHQADISTAYYQYDQQGVVFNMWYLAFLEEGRNSYFVFCGYPLERLLEDGLDIQVVHATLDWSGPARYGDNPVVHVGTRRVGTTSLALNFAVSVEGRPVLAADMTFVIVDAASGTKAPLPPEFRAALGES